MNKLFLLASLGILVLAPSAQHLSAADAVTSNQPGTMMAQDKVKSDEDITLAVKAAIAADKDLSVFLPNINITTSNRVVTLTGSVDTEKAKNDIEAKAKAVSGVDKIVNDLKVQSVVQK